MNKRNSSRKWQGQSKPMRAWFGFCDDMPHFYMNEYGREQAALFRTKALAQQEYEDVRAVMITLVKKR